MQELLEDYRQFIDSHQQALLIQPIDGDIAASLDCLRVAVLSRSTKP